MSPLRIAMVSMHGCPLAKLGEKDAGGMNVYVRELSRALGASGSSVDIFTRCQDYSTTQIVELGPGARVVHIEAGAVQYIDKRNLFPILPEFTDRVKGFRLEDRVDYDIIHTHYWLSGWSGLRLREAWGLPLVSMFHTLGALKNAVCRVDEERESRLRVSTEREVVHAADRIIAANILERSDLERFYGADPQRISVVPCGVDVELFRPLPRADSRALLNLPEDARIVLFVGRLEAIKGVDVLLEALAKGHSGGTTLAVIAGGGLDEPEGRRLQALSGELGLGERVRFVGAVEQRTLPYFYSAADLCVVPSFYESFGMVAIEAMSCGLPVIASRAGGLQFTVHDQESGLLVPAGDSDALASAMQCLLGDAALRERMGQAGQRLAHRYGWRRVAKEMLRVYEGVLAGRAQG